MTWDSQYHTLQPITLWTLLGSLHVPDSLMLGVLQSFLTFTNEYFGKKLLSIAALIPWLGMMVYWFEVESFYCLFSSSEGRMTQ